jgi:hypothetical protein
MNNSESHKNTFCVGSVANLTIRGMVIEIAGYGISMKIYPVVKCCSAIADVTDFLQ